MSQPTTGIEILRAAALNRVKKGSYASLAQDPVKISADSWRSFAEGRSELPVEKLKALASVLFSAAEYDEASNTLRPTSARTPAQVACPAGPPKFNPEIVAKYGPPSWNNTPRKPGPPPAPVKKRAGWSGGFI